MPPKKKYSKEKIVEKAFEIAKTEGIKGITIRKVADKLNSSIAPIYVNFNDVDELIKEVIKKTFEIGKELIDKEDSEDDFEKIGRASLKFARDYPLLFRDIVMNPNNYLENYDEDIGEELVEQMKNSPELKGLEEDKLKKILLKMRIFQTGLSVMIANGLLPKEIDEEKAYQILEDTGGDIIFAAKEGHKRN